jgi:hypothetical protein
MTSRPTEHCQLHSVNCTVCKQRCTINSPATLHSMLVGFKTSNSPAACEGNSWFGDTVGTQLRHWQVLAHLASLVSTLCDAAAFSKYAILITTCKVV